MFRVDALEMMLLVGPPAAAKSNRSVPPVIEVAPV
jgi:hypothetical protein